MGSFVQDLRYAARTLRRNPGFVAVCVFSLAIGIGLNTAIFSLLDSTVLRPLPIDDLDRLVFLSQRDREHSYTNSSYPAYVAYRDKSDAFSGLTAYSSKELVMAEGDHVEQVYSQVVSGNYFSVLGVNTMLGRTFLDSEDYPASFQTVAVLSHNFWQRRFMSDREVVGKSVNLNGQHFTVVGVAKEGFTGTEVAVSADLWITLGAWAEVMREPERLTSAGHSWLEVIGRLNAGVSIQQAQAEMTALTQAIHEGTDPRREAASVVLSPVSDGHPALREAFLESGLPIAIMGFVIGALVLALACTNVGNLLLARAAVRQREIAIRLAVGSSRMRLIRQLLTESAVIALLGGLGGLLVAVWLVSLLLAIKPPLPIGELSLPSLALDFRVDPLIFSFTLLLSLIASLLFGLAPALQASKPDLISALKNEMPGFGRGARRLTLRSLFVVTQVAMSLLLLLAAGLFARSWMHAASLDPGFKTDHVLMLSLSPDQAGASIKKHPGFDQQVVERVAALPGVEVVSLVDPVPLWFGGKFAGFSIEGSEDQTNHPIGHTHVGAGYFATLRIPLLRGRDLSNTDTKSSTSVAIINETMAQRFWPGSDPLGKRIIHYKAAIEIVGVARDVKHQTLGEAPQPWIYIPLLQNTTSNKLDPTLLVRTVDAPAKMAAAIQREVKTLDPAWPIFNFKTMSDSLAIQFFLPRIMATFLGAIGLFGLLLAAAGVYGLVAYSVSQRTQEIGIRLALGARAGDILSLVIRQGVTLILIGLVIGASAAFLLTRFLAAFLNGVDPADPLTFVAVSLLFVAVAVLACLIPARRATKVDPMVALRHE